MLYRMLYRMTHQGCDFKDDYRAFIQTHIKKLNAFNYKTLQEDIQKVTPVNALKFNVAILCEQPCSYLCYKLFFNNLLWITQIVKLRIKPEVRKKSPCSSLKTLLRVDNSTKVNIRQLNLTLSCINCVRRFGCYQEKNPKSCHLLGDYWEGIKRDFSKESELTPDQTKPNNANYSN